MWQPRQTPVFITLQMAPIWSRISASVRQDLSLRQTTSASRQSAQWASISAGTWAGCGSRTPARWSATSPSATTKPPPTE